MRSRDEILELPQGPVRVRIRGEGPPLVWSHGVFFPIDVDDHSTLGKVLLDVEGFTVIRWDSPGHGLSPHLREADDHRWERLASPLLELADALELDQFALGGISMGAALSLFAALRAPERVRAMLLVAPPTAWSTRPAEQERYRALSNLGTPEAVAASVRDDLDAAFGGAKLPPALATMIEHLRAASPAALSRVLHGAAHSDLPPEAALRDVDVPVLVAPWPNDPGHPISTAEALAKGLPAARLATLASFEDEAGIREAFAALRGLVAS